MQARTNTPDLTIAVVIEGWVGTSQGHRVTGENQDNLRNLLAYGLVEEGPMFPSVFQYPTWRLLS